MARLVQEYEEVSAAIGEAGAVLNRPLEIDAASGGLRPKFAGAIDTSGYMVGGLFAFMMLSGRVAQPLVSFQDVTFTYGGTKIPALSGVNFSIPAGTMLGIVGKSGSGKSTKDSPLVEAVSSELVSVQGGFLKRLSRLGANSLSARTGKIFSEEGSKSVDQGAFRPDQGDRIRRWLRPSRPALLAHLAPLCERTSEPGTEHDWIAAKQAFGGRVTRARVREMREKMAPDHWGKQGRRPASRGE